MEQPEKDIQSPIEALRDFCERSLERVTDNRVEEAFADYFKVRMNPTSQLSHEEINNYLKKKELEEDPRTLQMLQEQARNQSVHVGGLKSTSKLHHPTILRKDGKIGKRLKVSGGSNGDLSMMKGESFESEDPDIDFIKIWKISSFFMPASLKKKVFAPAFEDLKQDLLLSEEYKDSNPNILKCAFMTKTACMYLNCLYEGATSKIGKIVLGMLPDGLSKYWKNQ